MLTKQNIRRMAVILAISGPLLVGCRSTEEYKRLATAGSAYSNGLSILLDSAGDIKVDTTSEQLLQDDRITPQDIEHYQARSEQDVRRLRVLSQLKEHNKLLNQYFLKLNELASSDSPQRTSDEIGGIITNINTIGTSLRGSGLIPSPSIFQGLARLIVSSKIKGDLREELDQRADTINEELYTQEILLKLLSQSMMTDLTIIKQSQETRTVIRPYIQENPIAAETQWIADRREVLKMNITIAELQNAENAAASFRAIFTDFVEGDLNIDRLNYLLTEIESFLSLAEAVKNEQEAN